jgi:crossover junction endonuclease MUS81
VTKSALPVTPPASNVFEFDFDLSRSPSPPLRTVKASRLSAASDDRVDPKNKASSNRFQFWYISSLGTRVHALSEAMIRLDPDEFVNLRKIEYRFHQREHPFVQQQVRLADEPSESRVRDDSAVATLMGYVLEEGAPPKCSTFGKESFVTDGRRGDAAKTAKGSSKKRPSAVNDDDGPLRATSASINGAMLVEGDFDLGGIDMTAFHDDDDFFPLDLAPPVKRARAATASRRDIEGSSTFARTTSAPVASTGKRPARAQDLDLDALDEVPGTSVLQKIGIQQTTASMSTIEAGPSRARPQAVASRGSAHDAGYGSSKATNPTSIVAAGQDTQHSARLLDTDDTSATPTFHPSNAIVFPPGSYDIILIIDTREIESKSSRDRIAESLLSKGVRVETRALKLGDMMWIARYNDGHGGEEDECVLDYVVERKRLDDLCTSIRDGRYTEQCVSLATALVRYSPST